MVYLWNSTKIEQSSIFKFKWIRALVWLHQQVFQEMLVSGGPGVSKDFTVKKSDPLP